MKLLGKLPCLKRAGEHSIDALHMRKITDAIAEFSRLTERKLECAPNLDIMRSSWNPGVTLAYHALNSLKIAPHISYFLSPYSQRNLHGSINIFAQPLLS